jgi:phosphomethylpyrimidine synthase
MTQMKRARSGEITDEMKAVGKTEKVDAERIRRGVASGRIVIPKNVSREDIAPVGIGEGLLVKVNANIGTSSDFASIDDEIEKAAVAVKYGADTLMDLSTGGNLEKIRSEIMKVPVPLGTVPIYEAGTKAIKHRGSIVDMREVDLFNVIEKQAKEGIDFMTLHVGLNTESLEVVLKEERTTGIVSRGGSFLAAWMIHNKKENPLYSDYDYLLELAKEYDITLSLGDALRPGCIKDATDSAQIKELLILGELTKRARKEGVQCMVEGPGHVPLNEIEANVAMQKKICDGAPFYVLGPLVTDIACGYDHISGAIGGAVAAHAGADFLCYVTPSEHLALPDLEDVRVGTVAFKIAAHAADIARGGNRERDLEMSKARFGLDWDAQLEFCIDPEKARAYRDGRVPHDSEACSMCGEFCAMKMVKEYLK